MTDFGPLRGLSNLFMAISSQNLLWDFMTLNQTYLGR